LVPESPLDIDKLVTTTRAVRKARLLRPPGASPVSYRVPEQAPLKPRVRAARRVQPTAIRFAMVSKSPPTRLAALAVGDVLRQAAVKRSPQSATVSGHVDQDGPRVGQHRHAHYLSFAADPGRGHLVLDTAVVWAPAGFEADDTLALARIGRLHGRQYLADFRSTIRLGVEAVGPVEEVAPELSAVSSSWESFTPFAPGRHWKRGSKEEFAVEAVQAELVYRGLPPARVSLVEPGRSRWPVAGGWVSFRRHRPSKERLRDAAWAFGMRLEFDEPVAGPIALGKSSHMGLGLFLPV
jgi:CRISPR-associated protein Csb2